MPLLQETFLGAPRPGYAPLLEGSPGFLFFIRESIFHTILQLLAQLSMYSLFLHPHPPALGHKLCRGRNLSQSLHTPGYQ